MHRREVPLTQRCSLRWAQLEGGDAVRRHCPTCDEEVTNLSAMRAAEAEEFLARVSGPVCLAYRHAPDGAIHHLPDVPLGRLRGGRAPAWVGALTAASLAACSAPSVPKTADGLRAKCDRLFPAEPGELAEVVEVVAPDPAPPLAPDEPSVDCELYRQLEALGGYFEVPEECD